jgi:hypothetical protein
MHGRDVQAYTRAPLKATPQTRHILTYWVAIWPRSPHELEVQTGT